MEQKTIFKENNGSYSVVYPPNFYLGDIGQDVDGFYYFFPAESDICVWSENFLFDILVKLRELNYRWELEINTSPLVGGEPFAN